MSAKLLSLVASVLLLTLLGAVCIVLWNENGDRRSHQEGFRQLMDKKVHGRDLFDGFTSDPTPRRKEK